MRESAVMRQRHAAVLADDPFYNIHFSRAGGVYRALHVVRPHEEKAGPDV